MSGNVAEAGGSPMDTILGAVSTNARAGIVGAGPADRAAELADERVAVARAITAHGLTPVMFELGARPHPPRELYRAYLDGELRSS